MMVETWNNNIYIPLKDNPSETEVAQRLRWLDQLIETTRPRSYLVEGVLRGVAEARMLFHSQTAGLSCHSPQIWKIK